jgi:hydrogenase nickel incorporation protein HypA/HybF
LEGSQGEEIIHEAAIAQNILRIVEEAARANDLSCVSSIVLEIGQFSGVEVGALDFAFSVFKEGSILEEAEIEYLTPPLMLYCQHCETEYLGDWEDLQCPACLETEFDIIQGQELKIKSIVGDVNGQG